MISKFKVLLRLFWLVSITTIYVVLFVLLGADPKVYGQNSVSSMTAIIFIINYLFASIISFYVMNSKRYQSFKTVWVFLIFLVPFLGQVFFLFWGITGIERRTLEEYKKDLVPYLKHESYQFTKEFFRSKLKTQSDWKPTFKYLWKSCERPIYDENQVVFLENPAKNIKAIESIIKKATKFIHIEYYYIAKGMVSNYILELLKQKLQEGVEVRIIVDYLGSRRFLPIKQLNELKKYGLEWRFFNPLWTIGKPLSQINYRCHKKILIVDNKYAIYGSANIADHYYGISRNTFPLFDYSYYLEGPIVNSFNLLFAFDWHKHTKNNEKEDMLLKNANKYFGLHYFKSENHEICQMTEHGPDIHEKIIVNNLIQLIANAKKKVLIATPYFFPSQGLFNILKITALSGVKITLLLPKMPHPKTIVLTMNRYQYKELLAAGIEIYEYQGYNHEKVIIIDDELVFTGTYNWDFRSLYINYETAMQILSPQLATKVSAAFFERVKNADSITMKRYEEIWTLKYQVLGFLLSIFHPLL